MYVFSAPGNRVQQHCRVKVKVVTTGPKAGAITTAKAADSVYSHAELKNSRLPRALKSLEYTNTAHAC